MDYSQISEAILAWAGLEVLLYKSGIFHGHPYGWTHYDHAGLKRILSDTEQALATWGLNMKLGPKPKWD